MSSIASNDKKKKEASKSNNNNKTPTVANSSSHLQQKQPSAANKIEQKSEIPPSPHVRASERKSPSSPSARINKPQPQQDEKMAREDAATNEEENWFRNLSIWIICLCLALDLGSILTEVWKAFLLFSANVAASTASNNNNQQIKHKLHQQPHASSSSSPPSSTKHFDEQQYTINLVEGIHVFALLAHLLIPIPIYLAARARYGSDQFLAWQPFSGGVAFIASETGAFVLWVAGLVVRWSQIFALLAVLSAVGITSSSSTCGANPDCQKKQQDLSYYQHLFVPPHPGFVQKSAHDFVAGLTPHLPESVIANMEILSDDPQVYHAVAFAFSPKIRTLIAEISFAGLGRICHSLGSAILFFYSLTAFSPKNQNNEDGNKSDSNTENKTSPHHRRVSSKTAHDNVAKNAYSGSLLSWLFKSGRVLSDVKENVSLCWHHNSVRGTIISVLLTMAVTLYFLVAALLYAPDKALDVMTNRHYVYFFLWKIPFPVLSKVILAMHIVCGLQAHFIFGLANITGFTIFKPFVGPNRYIMLQMISWTAFGVAVVLYRAVAPSLETFDVIPWEGWIAANTASLASSFLLLMTSCCRFLYWNGPSLFGDSVRPADVSRVSMLFTIAVLVFYGLFLVLSPTDKNSDLIERVMRQLAICSVCIGPVSQTVVWLVIPVYNFYMVADVSSSTSSSSSENNNNNNNNNQNIQQSPLTSTSSFSSSRRHHVDATWKLVKQFSLLFLAAEVWVLALALLFVLPCSNESSAIVICLSILAQAMYTPLLQRTCGSAYTILGQFRQQQKQQQQISSPISTTNNNNYNNKIESLPSSPKKNNSSSPTVGLRSPSPSRSSFDSPRLRRALSSLFLDLDERITVNGPMFLSFSLFAHSLIFRWTLAVISVSHLFIPVELAKLATFSFSGDFSRNASIIHQNSWSTLASFGLACAFFATACCVPMAHFCIRGLRGLVVNPFVGTPAFAATQVSSWISHLVCFAFLLYLLVNDLLSSSSSSWSSSVSPVTTSGSRISFESSNTTAPVLNYSQLKSRHEKDKIVRMVITVIGNCMLETGAMIFPYVLALASVFSFDSTLRQKYTEKQKTDSIVEVASSLTVDEKKLLCKIVTNKNNNKNLTRLVEMILSSNSNQTVSIDEHQKRLETYQEEAESILSTNRQESISSIVELGNNNKSNDNFNSSRNNKNQISISASDFDDPYNSKSDNFNLLATVHPAVLVLTVFALSCASFLLNLIGEKMLQSEVLANAGNVPDVALVFIPAFLGFLACTGALLISHAWLGPALYKEGSTDQDDDNINVNEDDFYNGNGNSAITQRNINEKFSTPYVLWMPFKGGLWFILIQIAGFSAFAAVLVQTVFCFAAVLNRTTTTTVTSNLNARLQHPSSFASSVLDDANSASNVPVSLIPVAILSGIAPLVVALSSFFFVPPTKIESERDKSSSTNATGNSNNNHNRKLSGIIVQGSSSSNNKNNSSGETLSLYDNAEGIICLLVLLGGWIVSMFADKLTPSEWASATAPLIIVSILITIAAPLGVVSLRKSAHLWKQQQEQFHHHHRHHHHLESNPDSIGNINNINRIRIRKTILQNGQEIFVASSEDDNEEDDDDILNDSGEALDSLSTKTRRQVQKSSPKKSSSTSSSASSSAAAGLLAPPLVIVESAIVSLLCVLPLAVVYALYQLASSASSTVGFEVWYTLQESTRWLFGLLTLGIFVMFYARGFLGVAAMYFGTYMMFLIPNMPYIIAVAFPLLRPNSVSAAWVPIEFCISVPLPAHWIQPLLFIFDSALLSVSSRRLICLLMSSYQVFGAFTGDTKEMFCGNLATVIGDQNAQHHQHLEAANYLFGSTILQALEHTIIFLFCVMYKFSFIGSPAVRGSHRSRQVEDFVRKTAIASMEKFFNLRIFAEQSYVLDVNKQIKEMEAKQQDSTTKTNQKAKNAIKNQDSVDNKKSNNNNNNDEIPTTTNKLNFMFGFHPHGILAFTCAWVPISNVWREMGLPRRVARFGASIIFNVPILRDAAMSMGARVVTKEAIHCALTESNATVSAMLVPGGQAEMLQSKPSKTEVFVKNHHTGFLRIALRTNKPAVPVYCFGEHDFMENVQMPKIQKFFLRLIGFGLPVVPMGALGILPLPRRTALTIVVGKPIEPEFVIMTAKEKWKQQMASSPQEQEAQNQNNNSNGSKSTNKNKRKNQDDDDCGDHGDAEKDNNFMDESFLVNVFAELYFEELKRIFYKYRAEAGYPELELHYSGKDY